MCGVSVQQSGEAFTEDDLRAVRWVATEAADDQAESNGSILNGKVRDGPAIATVHAVRGRTAARAISDQSGGGDEGDRSGRCQDQVVDLQTRTIQQRGKRGRHGGNLREGRGSASRKPSFYSAAAPSLRKNLNYMPITIRRMKEILAAGEIGRPLAVRAATATPFEIGAGEEGYWRVVPEQGGGGALMDIGSHRLDLFLDFFGEVLNVRAICSTFADHYDAEDVASLVLNFQSGVHGVLECFFGTTVLLDEFTILGRRSRPASDCGRRRSPICYLGNRAAAPRRGSFP